MSESVPEPVSTTGMSTLHKVAPGLFAAGFFAAGWACALAWSRRARPASTKQQLQLLQEIPLALREQCPNNRAEQQLWFPTGRVDHFGLDEQNNLLFVACLGADAVLVVDAFRGQPIHRITHQLNQPQGVLFVAETGRLYVANAGNGVVNVFGGTAWDWIGSIALGAEADNLRYLNGFVYVGYGDGEDAAIAVIADDPAGFVLTDRCYQCPAHPEAFLLTSDGSTIFVNVADLGLVCVIDTASGSTRQWQLPSGMSGNFPIGLDEISRSVFVGVRQPLSKACVLVIDMHTGAVRESIETCGDMDDLCFDATRRQLYVVGGTGTVSVLGQNGSQSGGWDLLSEVSTGLGARTGCWVGARDSLYVAVPASGARLWPKLKVFHSK